MVNVIDLPAMVLILLEQKKPEPSQSIKLRGNLNGELVIITILANSPNITLTGLWECNSVFVHVIDTNGKSIRTIPVDDVTFFVTKYLNSINGFVAYAINAQYPLCKN